MRLRPVSVALALLLLLVLAYTAWWVSAANQLKNAVAEQAERLRASGHEVTYEGPEAGGYPLALSASVRNLVIRRPDGLLWQGQALTAGARPWAPRTVEVRLPGWQRVTLPAAGGRPQLDLVAPEGRGEALLREDGTVRSFKLALPRPTLSPVLPEGGLPGWPEMITAFRLTVGADWPEVPPADHKAPGMAAAVRLEAVALPPIQGLGRTLDWLDLTARVMGPVPPALTAADVAPWSQAGGTVELELARLDWGRLNMAGSATLALDGQLQPIGAGSVKARGFEAVIDALQAAGNLQPNHAAMAQAALQLMAQKGEDGVRVLTLPLNLQERRLSVGPLPIAEVPPLQWP
jgi:hypothetical protein